MHACLKGLCELCACHNRRGRLVVGDLCDTCGGPAAPAALAPAAVPTAPSAAAAEVHLHWKVQLLPHSMS